MSATRIARWTKRQLTPLFLNRKSSHLDGIIAVVIQALLRLRKSVIKDKPSFLFALIIIGIYLLGVGEIPLLLISALIMLIIKNSHSLKDRFLSLPLSMIFWLFLKIGLVLYGSGYVLLAFLEAEFVQGLGVLTTTQIIDAIAIGQFKPGPVFATATFIGYFLHGIPGAILATIGIFLPAFLLVLILNPIMHKLRESKILSAMLDGVNIWSLVLMLVVSIKLGMASITNWITFIIFLASYIAITKLKINLVWTIIAGGVIGFITL